MSSDLRANGPASRADFRDAAGVLLVLRDAPPAVPIGPGQTIAAPPKPEEAREVLIAVWDDGSVTALNGHVDLGTGIQTSLAQIAAEELDLPLERVVMHLGHTTMAPNQGPTVASSTLQIHAIPLRNAAAQAREWLLEQAAARLGTAVEALVIDNGMIFPRADRLKSVSFRDLLSGQHIELALSDQVKVKSRDEYRLVGTSVPRTDIPAKVTGELRFVHDMRVPGMLHGRVVRPPYAGIDSGDFVGRCLEEVDRQSVAHIPGLVAVVAIGDFVGVVAEREENAERAMRELRVKWKPWPGLTSLNDLGDALRKNPSTPRVLAEKGDVQGALAGVAQRLKREYVWPYQMHASIGPSCALADWREGALRVWAGTQSPFTLRAELGLLMGFEESAVEVIRMEASGCYGRNGADDVAADAALLSRAVRGPVRVQLTREQEHVWEPKGAAQLMEVDGGLDETGAASVYDFQTYYPSNGAPTLALLLTRTLDPAAAVWQVGDRTAVPPYEYPNLRVVCHDMPPILRAAWLRGVSAMPNSFAHESYIDELATAAGVDPMEFRLRYLHDERAADLVKATAQRAGWVPHTSPRGLEQDGEIVKGQGIAYARYIHSKFPGFGAAWAAWVADVEVNRSTGAVHVSRVVVGQDAGLMINPAGVQHQIHGNVIQTTSRTLKESVAVDDKTGEVVAREWGAYPILTFNEVPTIDVVMMPRPDDPPLGGGESSSVPGTAAIANAIFDATGVRFRQPPFTPEVVKAALNPPPPAPAHPPSRKKTFWRMGLALAGATFGIAAAVVGWKPAIAPVAATNAGVYADAIVERGRILANAGNCIACHTRPGGEALAGGRLMRTPFGEIYTTNLTPDTATGIGSWSFSAFQRAMREGISRDGHRLYPAFPYTSFSGMSDDDLTALFAYLMSQQPVSAPNQAAEMRFPFGYRQLLAAWNAIYLDAGPRPAQLDRSASWNRGAYLVNSVGHCSACHSPRDGLGGEKTGRLYLAGAVNDGWEAPALSTLATGPVPWTQSSFFSYLRKGYSSRHGAAAGPMADVVGSLSVLTDADVQAMAEYLASLSGAKTEAEAETKKVAAMQASRATSSTLLGRGQRMFESACGACHHDGVGAAQSGLNLSLALNSNLHSNLPGNTTRIILEGIRAPGVKGLGYMPAFDESFSDAQIAELLTYLRARFAPDKPAWENLEAVVAKERMAIGRAKPPTSSAR